MDSYSHIGLIYERLTVTNGPAQCDMSEQSRSMRCDCWRMSRVLGRVEMFRRLRRTLMIDVEWIDSTSRISTLNLSKVSYGKVWRYEEKAWLHVSYHPLSMLMPWALWFLDRCLVRTFPIDWLISLPRFLLRALHLCSSCGKRLQVEGAGRASLKYAAGFVHTQKTNNWNVSDCLRNRENELSNLQVLGIFHKGSQR